MTNTPRTCYIKPLGPQNINNKISLQVLMYNIYRLYMTQWQKQATQSDQAYII